MRRILLVARIGDALVEGHDDVGAQRFLDGDGLGRIEEDLLAGDLVPEVGAIFGDPLVGERKHLESAGVGEDRPVPAHEFVQSAGLFHERFARAKVKVIGVGEDYLGAGFLHLHGGHCLHRGVGSDRHENRSFDDAVGGGQTTAAGAGVCSFL